MKPVVWQAIACVLTATWLGAWFGREVWIGMLAPLVVATVTWVLAERVFRTRPDRLTSIMIGAFAGKLLFFGAYVGLAIGVVGVQPVPFAVSFTAYFIALHLTEALLLKRLFVC